MICRSEGEEGRGLTSPSESTEAESPRRMCPSEVNLEALERRLLKTCRKRRGESGRTSSGKERGTFARNADRGRPPLRRGRGREL